MCKKFYLKTFNGACKKYSWKMPSFRDYKLESTLKPEHAAYRATCRLIKWDDQICKFPATSSNDLDRTIMLKVVALTEILRRICQNLDRILICRCCRYTHNYSLIYIIIVLTRAHKLIRKCSYSFIHAAVAADNVAVN